MDFKEFEREGRAKYAVFAKTVASILTAAISADEGYRLQQVKDRAKLTTSLQKKLEERGLTATVTLENDIKDLAGCRVIFYTNSDVTRLINSGIIKQNFDVLDVKLHHPMREAEDSADLYISNHYLVTLREERIALPEYAGFAGMRCEIQIQTILNHAWAEMAHDTIYKAPLLGDFGGRTFDGIKSRMRKVARKYLMPAGYEFQKIASDFQRLIEGKALFDGDALEAIVEAANNNVRAEALETFAENVLPLYDDLQEVYPEIVAQLIVAAGRARTTLPTPIDTPYGALPAKTYGDIVKAIADILTRYRYLDIDATLTALQSLYGLAGSEDERKPLLELGKALAKHQMQVWLQHGPTVQAILVERFEVLGEDECRCLGPLLIVMLGEMLGAEVSGTTSNSNSMTLHREVVIASDVLRTVRTKAIELLKRQFALAETDKVRRTVLLALQAATRHPYRGNYSNAIARIVMSDTRVIIEFQTEIVPMLSLGLRQAIEDQVHRYYWSYADLPEAMRDDLELVEARSGVEAAAIRFRDVVNADPDFVIYKTLVGFNSVFPPAWVDKDFQYAQAKAYRDEHVGVLLTTVDKTSENIWFDRISRYSRTESDDAATFPVFGNFLERMAEMQPDIVFNYLDTLEEQLANFLPGMFAGLMRSSEQAQALARIDAWLRDGVHIRQIAWYLRFADPFDESLLRRTLQSATKHNDEHAVRNVLIATVSQFATHPGTLVAEIFLPALRFLVDAGNFSWVRMQWFSWLDSPIIRALDEEQARVVLNALIPYPDLDYDAEYIAAAIAERWASSVVTFFGERQAFARTDASPLRYDAVPFEVHQLQPPLATAPDIMLVGARTWFDADPLRFTFDGGRLIASIFPDLSNGLELRLTTLVALGNEQDLAFVLGILSAYEGKPHIYELVRAIVAALNPESQLLLVARSVLQKSGVVTGEFGFAELHAERKALLETWIADPSEEVKTFATELIRELDRQIAAENQSAEASIALRRLEYGEELDGNDHS